MREKPNILSPTMRERRRYLVFQVVSKEKMPFSDISNGIWHSVLNFLGELGTAESEVWVIKNSWDEEKQLGIIRCEHTAVEKIRTALALVQRIGDQPVIVRVLGVSGTIKSAKKKFFGEVDLLSFA